jgi:hypothetical protein
MQKFCQQLRSWQAINPVPAGIQLSVCKHAVLFGLTDDEERVKYQTRNRVQVFFKNILRRLALALPLVACGKWAGNILCQWNDKNGLAHYRVPGAS